MVVFPNAKINLGLNIIHRRNDGYHNILSVFCPINLCDVLEFVEAADIQDDSFTTSGLRIQGSADHNLCIKALHLIREVFPVPPLRIHLHKIIPMGAGLGGGSADGSFFLSALNAHFNIGLSTDTLKELALKLGSDCPFFIENKPVAVSGRGEVMKNVNLNLKGTFVVMILSDVHIATAKAYQNIILNTPEITPQKVVQEMALSEWKKYLTNDFESYAFQAFPQLRDHKDKLYKAGAEFAAMTGSGSGVFGIFNSLPRELTVLSGLKYWVGRFLLG